MRLCFISLLVNKPVNGNIDRHDYEPGYFPPISLAYLAGYARKFGHTVKIIDRNIIARKQDFSLSKTNKATIDELKQFNPNIIGFNVFTTHLYDLLDFSGIVKEEFPNSLLIAGGPHPTAEPENTLKRCKALNIVFRGEGELALINLINKKPLAEIKGVTYRKGNKIVSNFDCELVRNLDEIPFPARDLLDMDFHTAPSEARYIHGRTTSIITSRGCPFACNYCSGPLMFKGVRFNSAKYVIAEIENIINNYNVNMLYFADDMFLAHVPRAKEICSLMIKKRINKRLKWVAQIRAEYANEDILRLMKKAGCVQVEFGFESGSQRILDLMNKRTKVEIYHKAAAIAKKVGVRFQVNIITDYPTETKQDFMLTMNLLRKVKPNVVQMNLLFPLPGTKVYHDLLKKEYNLHWSDSSIDDNFTAMSKQEFTLFYKKAQQEIKWKYNWPNYLKYHLFKHPFPMLKAILKFVYRFSIGIA